MGKRPPYARIAITLPPEDLEAADRLARECDRSRSWIVAEAVRHFVAARKSAHDADVAAQALRSPGIGASRLLQLRRDLALTPEQRVLIAEQTLRNVPSGTSSPPGPRCFDRYEDFLDWKSRRARTP